MAVSSPTSNVRAFASLLKERLVNPPRVPVSNSTNLLNFRPSDTEFINSVEKHLGDVRSGVGYISKDVAGQLSGRNASVSEILAETNPRALKDYSGYSSALNYSERARLVTGIEQSIRYNRYL